MKKFFLYGLLLYSSATFSFFEGMAFLYHIADKERGKCETAQDFLRVIGIEPTKSCEEMESEAWWLDDKATNFRVRFQRAIDDMMTVEAENRYRAIVEKNMQNGISEKERGLCESKIRSWQTFGLFPNVDAAILCNAVASEAEKSLRQILDDRSLTLVQKYQLIGLGESASSDFKERVDDIVRAERDDSL